MNMARTMGTVSACVCLVLCERPRQSEIELTCIATSEIMIP